MIIAIVCTLLGCVIGFAVGLVQTTEPKKGSGKIKRAPAWVSKIGLESIFRLMNEISIARIKRIFYSFRFYKYIKHQPDWK